MTKKGKNILVGMSGGVDSSVAAFLLQKEGYEVAGVFIDFIGTEESERDFKRAQEVAKKLNIPIYKLDAVEIFKEKIIDKFVSDYKDGITPNPCVMCNPEMKFKILIQEANDRNIKYVATGHYARVQKFTVDSSRLTDKKEISNELPVTDYQLLVANDPSKDQSYFLYRLTQEQLGRVIFPLGDYLKSEVREIAGENNFEIKNEDESQDVCFIANNDFNKFISEKIENKSGDIVDTAGKKLGKHNGLHFYTIGQRKGINLGGDGPYYVVKKDLSENKLVVSNNLESELIWRDVFEIKNVNWISPGLAFPLEAKVKVRYRNNEEYAIISRKDNEIYEVKLAQKQKAITSGQSAVFYLENGEVLGGGIII